MNRKRKAAAPHPEQPLQAHTTFQPPIYFLGTILIIGLLIRLFYLSQSKSDILSSHLVIDAQFYDQWAQRIAHGDWLGKTVFYQDPLYAYFLACVYKIFGHSLPAVRLLQALLDTATIAVVYLLTKRLFNPLTGIISAAIMALLSPLVYYVGLLDKTTLSIFLISASLALIAEAIANNRYTLYASAGAAFGIAALSRGNTLIASAVITPWLLLNRETGEAFLRRLKNCICFGLAAIAVISTVALRNYLVGHDLVLITANPGLNFFIGNNPYSIGQYIDPPFIRGIPDYEYDDAKSAAEQFSGKQFSKPSEVSQYWLRQGLRFVVENPKKWLLLSTRKIFLAFHEFEIAETYSYDYFRSKYWSLAFPFLTFGIIAPLGVLGAFRYLMNSRPNVLHVFMGAYSLSLTAFFVTSRYRTPLLIALVPFASWQLVDLWHARISAKRTFSIASCLIVLVALSHWRPGWFAEHIVKPSLATSHTVAGALYAETGDLEKSVEELQAAVHFSPDSAHIYVQIGEVYGDHGDMKSAVTNYNLALRLDPKQDEAWEKMGIIYFNSKDYQQALVCFQNAVTLRPDEIGYRNNFNVATTLLRQNHRRGHEAVR